MGVAEILYGATKSWQGLGGWGRTEASKANYSRKYQGPFWTDVKLHKFLGLKSLNEEVFPGSVCFMSIKVEFCLSDSPMTLLHVAKMSWLEMSFINSCSGLNYSPVDAMWCFATGPWIKETKELRRETVQWWKVQMSVKSNTTLRNYRKMLLQTKVVAENKIARVNVFPNVIHSLTDDTEERITQTLPSLMFTYRMKVWEQHEMPLLWFLLFCCSNLTVPGRTNYWPSTKSTRFYLGKISSLFSDCSMYLHIQKYVSSTLNPLENSKQTNTFGTNFKP